MGKLVKILKLNININRSFHSNMRHIENIPDLPKKGKQICDWLIFIASAAACFWFVPSAHGKSRALYLDQI